MGCLLASLCCVAKGKGWAGHEAHVWRVCGCVVWAAGHAWSRSDYFWLSGRSVHVGLSVGTHARCVFSMRFACMTFDCVAHLYSVIVSGLHGTMVWLAGVVLSCCCWLAVVCVLLVCCLLIARSWLGRWLCAGRVLLCCWRTVSVLARGLASATVLAIWRCACS